MFRYRAFSEKSSSHLFMMSSLNLVNCFLKQEMHPLIQMDSCHKEQKMGHTTVGSQFCHVNAVMLYVDPIKDVVALAVRLSKPMN